MRDIRERFTANANEFDSLVMELFGQCKAEKLELLDRIESEYQREYLGQNQGELYRAIINDLRKELE